MTVSIGLTTPVTYYSGSDAGYNPAVRKVSTITDVWVAQAYTFDTYKFVVYCSGNVAFKAFVFDINDAHDVEVKWNQAVAWLQANYAAIFEGRAVPMNCPTYPQPSGA